MDWITGLQNAINYVEDHLLEELDYSEIAKCACCSNFYFQRVFGLLCGCTLGEYIRSRRLTLAGSELLYADSKVIDAAMKYGYENPESFCRAFTKFHGAAPSKMKAGKASLRSFSRLSVKLVIEGGNTVDYRIEKKEAFQVIAKSTVFDTKGEISPDCIHELWEQSRLDGSIEKLCQYVRPDNMFGEAALGIIFRNSEKGPYDYGIGVVYKDGEAAKGLTVQEVPAGTWLVLNCSGDMPDAFQEFWKKVYTEFLPGSGYQLTDGASIEVYKDANTSEKDYNFEIWLAVEEKK